MCICISAIVMRCSNHELLCWLLAWLCCGACFQTLLHKLRFPVQVVPVTATQAMPTPENVEAFNQLSIGPKTLSASKFKRPTNLRDIFTIDEGSQNEEDAAAPGEESKAAPTPGTATGVTGTPTQEDIRRVAEERRVNQRLVLLGEYISACSGESDLTIVSLPVPAINVEPQVRGCVCVACMCCVCACVCVWQPGRWAWLGWLGCCSTYPLG